MKNRQPRRFGPPLCSTLFMATMGLSIAACGDSGGETRPLDCAFLADQNNCFRQFTAEIRSCLGVSATATTAAVVGTYDQSQSLCTSPSGATVQLSSGVALPNWDFTVTVGGRQCLHYQETFANGGQTVMIDADGKHYEHVLEGGLRTITCPDGSRVVEETPLEGCPSTTGWYAYSNSTTQGSTILGFGLSDVLPVFRCDP